MIAATQYQIIRNNSTRCLPLFSPDIDILYNIWL